MHVLSLGIVFLGAALCCAYPTTDTGPSTSPVVLIQWIDIAEPVDDMIKQRTLIEKGIMPSLPQGSRVVLKSVGHSATHRKIIYDVTLDDITLSWEVPLESYWRSNPDVVVSASSVESNLQGIFLETTRNKRNTRTEILIMVTSAKAHLVNADIMDNFNGDKKTYVVLAENKDQKADGSDVIWKNAATDSDHVFSVSDFDKEAFSRLISADAKLICDINQFVHPVSMACSPCTGTCSLAKPMWIQQSKACRKSCKYFLCRFWGRKGRKLSVCPAEPSPTDARPDPLTSSRPNGAIRTKPTTIASTVSKTPLVPDVTTNTKPLATEPHTTGHVDNKNTVQQLTLSDKKRVVYPDDGERSVQETDGANAWGRIKYLAIVFVAVGTILALTGVGCYKIRRLFNRPRTKKDWLTKPLITPNHDKDNDGYCEKESTDNTDDTEKGYSSKGIPVVHPDVSPSVPQTPIPTRDRGRNLQPADESRLDRRPPVDNREPGISEPPAPTEFGSDRSSAMENREPRIDQQPPMAEGEPERDQQTTDAPYDLKNGANFLANALGYGTQPVHSPAL